MYTFVDDTIDRFDKRITLMRLCHGLNHPRLACAPLTLPLYHTLQSEVISTTEYVQVFVCPQNVNPGSKGVVFL